MEMMIKNLGMQKENIKIKKNKNITIIMMMKRKHIGIQKNNIKMKEKDKDQGKNILFNNINRKLI